MITLQDLSTVLEARKADSPDDSYVASLYAKGLNKILEKVGEEATEVIIAAKDVHDGGRDALIGEVADLWFHSLVMLAHLDLGPDDILTELDRRFGTSGHDEKAARNP